MDISENVSLWILTRSIYNIRRRRYFRDYSISRSRSKTTRFKQFLRDTIDMTGRDLKRNPALISSYNSRVTMFAHPLRTCPRLLVVTSAARESPAECNSRRRLRGRERGTRIVLWTCGATDRSNSADTVDAARRSCWRSVSVRRCNK